MKLRVENLVPAGVTIGLARARRRAAAVVTETPILFIGVVLGIAVLFRVTIDAVRPAHEATAESAPLEAPRRTATANAATANAAEPSREVPTTAGARMAEPPRPREARPLIGAGGAPTSRHAGQAPAHRRKARTHGKR